MPAIDGNYIKDAVVRRLASVYPPEITPVYDEKQEAHMRTPCFSVFMLPVSMQKRTGDTRRTSATILIRWIPQDLAQNKYEACAEIGNELMEVVDYAYDEDGIPIAGYGMSYEIVEGVLHFSVSYSVNAVRAKNDDTMKTLEVKEGIK